MSLDSKLFGLDVLRANVATFTDYITNCDNQLNELDIESLGLEQYQLRRNELSNARYRAMINKTRCESAINRFLNLINNQETSDTSTYSSVTFEF